jgi:hypothetical protein
MFKLGLVLIFAISVTFGYNTDINSDFTWHDVEDIEDVEETPDPKYTSINSEYERHYLEPEPEDVEDVGAVFKFQEKRGKLLTGK